MRYCVNCGVELAKSERICPLCGVEAINPREPFDETAERPYPRHVERINRFIDRRYISALISILLLIPLFTVLFCNLLADGALTWSLYVAGAELVLFTWFLLPNLQHGICRYGHVLLDGIAVAAMLFLIETMTAQSWFLLLGLPLAALLTVYAGFLTWLTEPRCRLPLLYRISFALVAAGLVTVGVEFFISLFRGAIAIPRWSMYALFPCLVLAAALMLLNRRAALKEEIRKRFFF